MEVSGLFIYPIKSCAPIQLNEMPMCAKGPLYDREWMLVQPNGGFLTGRRYPQMLPIGTEFTPDHSFIQVSIPGREEKLFLPLDPTKAPLVHRSVPGVADTHTLSLKEKEVRVWSVHCAGEDQGEVAATFFSDFLGAAVRLVRSSSRVPPRKVADAPGEAKYTVTLDDQVSYADGFPVLMTSESSLEDLNERLADALPMSRFRPNVVFKGAAAWLEDTMLLVQVGDLVFQGGKSCARCKMTTIDPATGQFDGKEPLVTLETFRRQKESPEDTSHGVMFGRNLIQVHPANGHSIRLGDSLTILNSVPAAEHIPK